MNSKPLSTREIQKILDESAELPSDDELQDFSGSDVDPDYFPSSNDSESSFKQSFRKKVFESPAKAPWYSTPKEVSPLRICVENLSPIKPQTRRDALEAGPSASGATTSTVGVQQAKLHHNRPKYFQKGKVIQPVELLG